jgi:plasmid stabilization system protein ParE
LTRWLIFLYFPLSGAPLSSIYDIATDYRFLVCGIYIVFYRPQGDAVLIDRILYGRRDYLAVLFGDLLQGETE